MSTTLRDTHPHIAAEVSRKSVLSADQVTSGSGKKLLWECSKDPDHEWEATVASRAKTGRGCPYCSGQRVLDGINDLATLRPDLVGSWADEKSMSTVSLGSNHKAQWTCELGHAHICKVADKVKGRECPVCANRTVLTGFNDLATKHPETARQWHPEKNDTLSPSSILFHSNTKAWWQCEHNPAHEWKTAIRNRTVLGSGCPYCSGQKVSPLENSLIAKHPLIAREFSADNVVSADTVSAGSHTQYLWTCEIGHSWSASVKNRTSRGDQCPICSGKVVVIGENDLTTTHPELSRQWADTKPVTEFSKGSHYPAMWTCNHGHSWSAEIYNRVRGNGCPECASSNISSVAEDEIRDYVVSLGFTVEKNRKVLGRKELDIYVPEKKFAVEYNSLYWHSEDRGKDKWYHYNKFIECQKQGISLFQVWEDDYKRNPELVKTMIAHKLGVNTTETVYARNTVFDKVSQKEAAEFMNTNHLQGSHKTSSSYGLRHKSTDELVAVISMAFKAKKNALEIVRFAASKTVPGGFTKLLSNAVKAYTENDGVIVNGILSYSHNDHSWGNVYERNGFVKVHGGVPGYFYIANRKREHRLNYSPKRFRERDDLIFEEGKTERELAEINGLVRIWDSGSSLWSKPVS